MYRKISFFVLIAFLISCLVTFSNFAAASEKSYSLIPGYGIIQNNTQYSYALGETGLKNENDKMSTELLSAFSDNKYLYAQLIIIDKELANSKQYAGGSVGDFIYNNPVYLESDGRNYECEITSTTNSGTCSMWMYAELVSIRLRLTNPNIGTASKFVLNFPKQSIKIPFTLNKIKSYSNLNNIGCTVTKNNISITALAKKTNGNLKVQLYPVIANNNYKEVLTNVGHAATTLDTGKRSIKCQQTTYNSYSIIGSNVTNFDFKVLPDDTNFTFKMPYITIKSSDSKLFSVEIPTKDKAVNPNTKLTFNDCILRITKAEIIKSANSKYDSLNITWKFENKLDSIKVKRISFDLLTSAGKNSGWGYGWEPKDKEYEKAISFPINDANSKKLNFRINYVQYNQYGDYKFSLGKK